MTVQNAAVSIGSLGNLKPIVALSILKIHITIITWIDAYKMEVFIIGWEKELLTKTGLIMKKATRKDMFCKKANGAQEV